MLRRSSSRPSIRRTSPIRPRLRAGVRAAVGAGWRLRREPAAAGRAAGALRATPPQFATAGEALHTVFGYDTFRGEQAAIIDQLDRRRRRGRADADRRRQEPLLPDPLAGARRHRRRRLPADRPDARPGRRAHRRRRAGGVPQLDAGRDRARRGSSAPTSPASSTSSTSHRSGCRPRRPSASSSAARSRSSPSTRRTACRSGATTSAPTTSRSPNSPSAGPTCRASPSRRRRPRRPTARSPSRLRLENAAQFVADFDRPNIQYRIVPKAEVRTQLLDFITHRAPERCGHRLRALAQHGRAHGRVPERPRPQGAAVPRGTRRRRRGRRRSRGSCAKTA